MVEEPTGVNPGWHVGSPQGTFGGNPQEHSTNDGTARPVQEQRIIQYAFGISLLLHLVLAAATWRIPLAPKWVARDPDAERTIEFLLEDPVEEPTPRTFVNVPDRLASEEPPVVDEEEQKRIAMHHSVAADNVIGGDSDTPAAAMQGDVDQVQIRRENQAAGAGQESAPLAVAEASSAAESEEQEAVEGEELDSRGEWAMPKDQLEVETGDVAPATVQVRLDGEPVLLERAGLDPDGGRVAVDDLLGL